MKKLIANLIAIYQAAVTAGRVKLGSVRKGISPDPEKLISMGEYPFIAFDDGGQSVEEVKSDQAQRRVFTVIIEIGVYSPNLEQALDDVLDLFDACKAELELEENRPLLYDSHIWAINVTTFAWGTVPKFFRGMQIMCRFYDLEPRFSDY